MTAPAAASHRGRSILAVLAGFLVTAVLSLGTDVVMHATGAFPGWGQAMSDGLFVWASAYRVVFTVLGGCYHRAAGATASDASRDCAAVHWLGPWRQPGGDVERRAR